MGVTTRLRKYVRWVRVPRVVKRVTDPLVGRFSVRIRSGVNQGLRWSLASAGSGYGSGRRAAKQMGVITTLLRPGDVVWDVGAHHGYVSLCAARRVGEAGIVYAFEPSERSRWFLRRHVAWNGLTNVRVRPYALSSFDGRARLGGGGTSKQHALGGAGECVEVRRASTLVSDADCPLPTFVKIDVEGEEANILRDALGVFGAATRLLVAAHSRRVHDECLALLREAGYSIVESERVRRYQGEEWRGDPDLYCFGPGYPEGDRDRAILERAGF